MQLARRLRDVGTSLVVAGGLLLSGCSTRGGSGADLSNAIPATPTAETSSPDLEPNDIDVAATSGDGFVVAACELQQNIRCLTDETGGVIEALVLGDFESAQVETVVLIDLGGPGGTVASVADAVGLFPLPPGTVLIAPIERWNSTLATDCDQATSQHLQSARRAEATDAGAWHDACSVHFGDQADVGRRIAHFIESHEQLADARHLLYGQSFASSRVASYGEQGMSFDRWLLVSPSEPSGPVDLAARADRMSTKLGSQVRAACEASAGFGCEDQLHQQLVRAAQQLPASFAQRSVSFTRFDLGAAIYGTAYAPAANAPWLAKALQEFPTGEASQGLGPMADAIQYRYSVESVAPSLAGYLIGVCANGVRLPVDTSGVLEQFLVDFHAVCSTGQAAKEQRPAAGALQSGEGCVFFGEDDPVAVAPSEWELPGEIVIVPDADHSMGILSGSVRRSFGSMLDPTLDNDTDPDWCGA